MAKPWAMRLYQSKAWADLRQTLIAERGMRCEECGRIILRSSEIVADHIKELTPDNVTDPAVALNQENIKLICEDCHNRKHVRFGYVNKEVFIIYGAPCSGKTTIVNQLRQRGYVIVDMDRLYSAISGCSLFDKPDNLRQVIFRTRDALLDIIRTRYGRWYNAYIVGGYPHKAAREELARRLNAKLIYCEATKEECLARAELRGTFAKEYKKYILKWFDEYQK